MIRLRQRLLAVMAGLGLFGAASAQDRAPVRIATEGARPPFNFVENGEPAGFEVDLARALCTAAGLTCTVVLHEWEGIIKGLLAKEYDAVMASMAINERRRARIAFTRPYYRMPAAFVGRRDGGPASLDPALLKGRTVGVAERSPYAQLLEQRYPELTVRTFDKVEDANLDLFTGRLDLVFGEKLELSRFVQGREGGACCRFVGHVPAGGPVLGEGIGIGLRKEDADLREALDRAIATVMADGTYDRIRAKYVPFDIK